MVMSMNTHQLAEPIPPGALFRGIRFPTVFALLCVILMLLFMASLLWGAVEISPAQAWAGLMRSQDAALETALIWQLRLPRALLGMLVGLQLATSGLILQAVIRNPLADPGIVGISSGSALAVVVALLWGDGIQADSLLGENHADMMLWLPLLAMCGGLLATVLVVSMSWRTGLRPIQLTLNGIAISSVLNALVMWSIVVWGGARTEIALIWLAGSLYGRDFVHVQVLWPWCAFGVLGVWLLCKPLGLLRLDHAVAAGLGIRGVHWRAGAIAVAIILAASAVAVTGPVGFVGLVIPHLARLLVGSDLRYLLPMTMLLGSALMLAADLLARTLISPLEIPVGALTTLLGIPVFLWLLSRQRRGNA